MPRSKAKKDTAEMPVEALDGPQVAGRRRKRQSSPAVADAPAANGEVREVIVEETVTQTVTVMPETPATRSSKRVRFSSNGESRRTTLPSSVSNAITTHSPRAVKKVRRISLPAEDKPHPGSPAIVRELQFAPITQVLNERAKRRLRRSRLSEEFDNAEEVLQADTQTRHEREAQREREDKLMELLFEHQAERQRGVGPFDDDEGGEEQIKALELQIVQLKQIIAEKDGLGRVQAVEAAFAETVGTQGAHDDTHDEIVVIDRDMDVEDGDYRLRSSFLSDHGGGNMMLETHSDDDDNLQSAQLTQVPDVDTEAQIRGLEQIIAKIRREASDHQAALEILTVELKHLGFGTEDSSSEQVLVNIREAFRKARLDLEHLLPGETASGFHNGQLLRVLVDRIRALLAELQKNKEKVESEIRSNSTLRVRFNAALEELSEEHNRRQALEITVLELNVQLEDKDNTIADFVKVHEEQNDLIAFKNDEIDTLQDNIDGKSTLLSQKDDRVYELEDEVGRHIITIERLRDATDSYLRDIQKLEALVARMEESHQEEKDNLKLEKEVALSSMQERVDAERRQRESAEDELDRTNTELENAKTKLRESGVHANQLRQRLYELQQDREKVVKTLQQELHDMSESHEEKLGEERGRRFALEAKVSDLDAHIAKLEQELDNASGRIQTLEKELEIAESSWKKEVSGMNGLMKTKDKDHSLAMKAKEKEIASLHKDISNLNSQLNERSNLIQQLQDEIRASNTTNTATVQRHEAQIASLTDKLEHANREINGLQKDKSGLEARVTEEAEQMLAYQEWSNAAMEKLKQESGATVTSLEQELSTLRDEFAHAVMEKEALIKERETTITTITSSRSALNARYRLEVEDANDALQQMLSRMQALEAQLKNEAELGLADAADILLAYREKSGRRVTEALEMIDEETVLTEVKSGRKSGRVTTTAVAGRKGRGRRGRGDDVADSGIGLADGQEDGTVLEA